jgi:hypothetical protein
MKEKSIEDYIIVELFDQENNFIVSDNKCNINITDNVFHTVKKIKQYKNNLWILCPIFGYTNKKFNVKIQNLIHIKHIKDMQTSYYGTLNQILLSINEEIYKNKKIKGVACISANSILKKLSKSSLKGGGGGTPEIKRSRSTGDDVSMTPPSSTVDALSIFLGNTDLDSKTLNMFRGTSRQFKRIAANIKNITFIFPSTLNQQPVEIVKSSIKNVCKSFGKNPSQCNMVVNCDCLITQGHSSCHASLNYTPSILILDAIIETGVLILPKIKIDDTGTLDCRATYRDAFCIEIINTLLPKFIFSKSLELEFSDNVTVNWQSSVHKDFGTVGKTLITNIKKMTQLKTLSITKAKLSLDQLTSLFTEKLSSFSIAKVIISEDHILGQPYVQKTPEEIAEKLTVLKTLSKIKIVKCPEILDALKFVTKDDFNKCTSLDFSDHVSGTNLIFKIYDALVDTDTKVPNLISLNLNNNCIRGEPNIIGRQFNHNSKPYMEKLVDLFKTLNNLQELNLGRNSLLDEDIAYMLTYIGRSSLLNEDIMDMVPYIEILPRLKSLNLSNNQLTLKSIIALIKIFPSLISLNISKHELFKEEEEESLKSYFPSIVFVFREQDS